MKKCKKCGFINQDDASFCENCGNTLRNKSNKRKLIPVLFAIILFLILIVTVVNIVELYNSEKDSISAKNQEQTKSYSNGDVVYRPGEENICYDADMYMIYYDNLLIAYLMSEVSDSEAREIAESVDGTVVGNISGCINVLQIMVDSTELYHLNELADTLMESDQVLYATYDFPMEISESDVPQNDKGNPWGAESDIGNEAKPDGNDWWAEAIGAYTAWKYSDGLTTQVTVGIIDTGFDTMHEEFVDENDVTKITPLDDFKENSASDHGTHVAGLIGANNNDKGIRGIVDQANLLYADWSPVTNDEKSPEYVDLLDTGEYIEITKQMIEEGACIINNSWVAVSIEDRSEYLKDIIDGYDYIDLLLLEEYDKVNDLYDSYIQLCKMRAKRTAYECMNIMLQLFLNDKDKYLIIQSAGNGYNNNGDIYGVYNVELAGCYCSITQENYAALNESCNLEKLGYSYDNFKDHILIVGAVENKKNYSLTTFSNYGDNVDIVAPGRNIYSTVTTLDDELEKNPERDGVIYYNLSGTSMAAPIVSGSAALIWSINPELSAGEVKQTLIETAGTALSVAKEDTRKEYPMLNVGRAVQKVIADVSNAEDVLADYASQYEYLYGQTYYGYLTNPGIGGYEFGRYDYSDIPAQNMGYLIYDFDGDEDAELLIVGLNDDLTLHLYMYEYKDGKAVQSAELDLAYYAITVTNSLAETGTTPGLLTCFTYGNDSISIGIEVSSVYNLQSDGIKLEFLSIKYENETFYENGHAITEGSGMDYDRNYMEELISLGIDASWETLYQRKAFVFEHLPNITEIVRTETGFLSDYSSAAEWRNRGKQEDLQCTEIYFLNEDELYSGDGNLYMSQENGNINAIDYEQIYNDFLESVKNIPYIMDLEGLYEVNYAIYDIDGNDIPECILEVKSDFLYYFIYCYDAESETVEYMDSIKSWDTPGFYYSAENSMVSIVTRTSDSFTYHFYKYGMNDSIKHPICTFSYDVGWWDCKDSESYIRYFVYNEDYFNFMYVDNNKYVIASYTYGNATEQEKAEEEYNKYVGNLIEITFTNLFSVDSDNIDDADDSLSLLEDKINHIRTVYYGIQNDLSNFSKIENRESGLTYYLDENDDIVKIIVPAGTYDSDLYKGADIYSAEYYYENNKIQFVFVFSGNIEYRYYMSVENQGESPAVTCIRWIDSDGTIYDYPEEYFASSEFSDTSYFCTKGYLEPHLAGMW